MGSLKALDLKSVSLVISKWIRQYRIDLLILIGLAISISIPTFLGTYQIPDPIFTDFYAQDAWFGSDLPTVFGNMTSLKSDFGRNNKHPLFPLFVFPIVFALGKLLSLDPLTATRLVLTLVATTWIAALYSLFRLMGCQRLDATLFSLLGLVSAASVFWFVVPDSFSFASLTIVLGLVFVALTQVHKFSMGWYVAVGVLTVSITITNWMVGLLATIVNHRWKKSLLITALTLLVSNALWIVQRVIFTNSGFPFQPKTFIGEKKFMTGPEQGSVLSALSSFTYQTIVMPAVQFAQNALRPDWVRLNADPLAPGSGSFWGMVAVVAWTALLLLGIWSFFSTKRHPKLRLVLGLTILGQLLIHSVYGTQETFLYSLHFAPLLLAVAAFSSLTRFRWIGLALAGLVIVSAGINNRAQFNQVVTGLLDYGTPQQQVQTQMKIRPGDHWPRSAGHIVLGATGSRVEEKGYHEPGGSFSPSVGSFGVAIWMVAPDGTVTTTSDAIPLKQIQQRLVAAPNRSIAGVSTKTKAYQANWLPLQTGGWQLDLTSASSNAQPVVMIRSVGPAAGNIQSLNWDGQRLLINDRWAVKNLPPSAKVFLGSERSPDWMRQTSTKTQWQDDQGWGVARLELGAAKSVSLTLEDTASKPQPDVAEAIAQPVLNLPDAQFTESFNAQIAHLKMGIVGNQTRPGDPIDYPLPRLRDGAYELVALARTGNLELAKRLVPYFAATDFVNGTQPEADIPALGIWALTTVATQVNQPEYDRQLWPDISRKAELIADLISTNRPGYPITDRSRIPFSERPDLLEMELTAGEMDATPGLIALDPAANYMSYRALLDAANLADRLNESDAANRWRSLANELQAAWQKAFDRPFAEMDATYTQGLWPSGLATANLDRFKQGLEERRQAAYDQNGNLTELPENTSFPLAEAHQWLLLNQPEQVWTTLRWFFQNQASPGLYTWWGNNNDPRGIRIPGSLSQWHRYRGWVNPPHFTPHHWTAAELLLLQLDMLAYVDFTTTRPTLVIGSGIPKDWLNQPVNVKDIWLGKQRVNWSWDGKQVTVQLADEIMPVRLGANFPKGTLANIEKLETSNYHDLA